MPDKRSRLDIKQRAHDVLVGNQLLLFNPGNKHPEGDIILGLLDRIRDLEEAIAVYDGIAEFYVGDDAPEYFRELVADTPDSNTLLQALEIKKHGG